MSKLFAVNVKCGFNRYEKQFGKFENYIGFSFNVILNKCCFHRIKIEIIEYSFYVL